MYHFGPKIKFCIGVQSSNYAPMGPYSIVFFLFWYITKERAYIIYFYVKKVFYARLYSIQDETGYTNSNLRSMIEFLL